MENATSVHYHTLRVLLSHRHATTRHRPVFKENIRIVRECDSRPSQTSQRSRRNVCACLCSFHALLCIQLTFAAQNHPRNADGERLRVGYMCQKSSQRLTNANPLAGAQKRKKRKKKVSPSSGNDQMIPVPATKSSSGRSDSCSKSYLTSKNPSSQAGSCPALNENPTARPPTRGAVLEGLPEADALPHAKPRRLMAEGEKRRGSSDNPQPMKSNN